MKTFSINTLKQVLLSAKNSSFTEYTIDGLITEFKLEIDESNFSQPTDDCLLDDELLGILVDTIFINYEPEIVNEIIDNLIYEGYFDLTDYLDE